jgi:hypothetical protein
MVGILSEFPVASAMDQPFLRQPEGFTPKAQRSLAHMEHPPGIIRAWMAIFGNRLPQLLQSP